MASAGKVARVVVCGLGRMGQLRVRAVQASPRLQLVAVADKDYALSSEVAAQFGCKAFADIGDALLVDGDNFDAAILSTPTFAHLEAIQLASNARKHIMVEKPVCEDVGDIAKAFAAANDANVALFCSFQRRFDRSYRRVKEAVANGDIGVPQLINVAFRDHPTPPIKFLVTGGDPFTDLMPHDADFVRTVLGEDPVEVYAMGGSFHDELKAVGVLDTAMAMLRFPSGAMCKIDMSRSSAYGYDQRCEVFGTKGSVEVGNVPEDAVVRSSRDGIASSVAQFSFPQRFVEAYAAEVDHFADIVLEGATPLVTENDCVQAQRIAQAALQSFREGGPVSLAPVH